MRDAKRVCFRGLLIVLFLVGSMWGQVPANNSGNTTAISTPTVSPPVNSDSEGKTEDAGTQVRYATSLSGSPLIMGDNIPSHIIFGATMTAGWDSNPNNTSEKSDTASKFFTLNPYIEFIANTGKSKSAVQYRSTNTSYGSQYAWQNMNVVTANALFNVTERLSWDLNAMGSYGRDSARFLGSDQTVSAGVITGNGPNSATYLQNAGIVTHVDANYGVKYKNSQRDSIEIRIGDSYSGYSGLNTTNRFTTAGMTYTRNLSNTIGMFSYLRDSYYHGYIHCSSYGVGAGLRWRPSEKIQIDASGGPQVNTSECGSQQGFSYNVSLSTKLTGNSQLYLLSARAPGTADIGLSVWQESVSGGYQRRVSSKAEAIFNVSFVANDRTAKIPPFHGTYLDCRYQVDFGHGLQGVYNYRGYFSASDGDQNRLSRNVTTFGLNWTPRANRLLQ